MSLNLVNFDRLARAAVKDFWRKRQGAKRKQEASGKADQGERSSVTAGKNMDGFLDMIKRIVRENGLPDAEIGVKRRLLTLPGYFRPTKLWDILVLHDKRLVACIELKSHVGPSFGNNFNNRTEEALGTALDLWTAYRENAFGEVPAPFVGWLMLVEDCAASRAPVRDASPHFPICSEFVGASYMDRYNILCRKLMQEKLYTTASVIASPREAAKTGEYTAISEMTGLRNFVTTLAAHIAAEGARA